MLKKLPVFVLCASILAATFGCGSGGSAPTQSDDEWSAKVQADYKKLQEEREKKKGS